MCILSTTHHAHYLPCDRGMCGFGWGAGVGVECGGVGLALVGQGVDGRA